MKEIQLTQGKVALVDDEDFDRLSKHSWCAHLSRKVGLWYAERGYHIEKNKQFSLGMHREIMGVQKGVDIDHRDRNGLNNQKSNLRICSRTLNQGNATLRKDSTTGFKGVSYKKENGKFVARVQFGKKRLSLGYFPTKELAAAAYDKAAIELFGEFARVNNI